MSQRRVRSINWEEEEKQLFRSVFKEYAQIIENKSQDTNTNKFKTKAWEQVHEKFNQLNGRSRELNHITFRWGGMKPPLVSPAKSFFTMSIINTAVDRENLYIDLNSVS